MLQDTTLDIDPAQLLANDIDPDGNGLTFVGFTDGPVTKLDNGLYRVTPAFNTYGPLVLTYAITNDSGVVVTTTVTIDVQHVPHAPTAVADNFAMTEDQPLVLDVAQLLANDSSLDSEAFGLTAILGASGVSAVYDAETGKITVTPDLHFHGSAWFDYQITDSNGLTGTARVNLDVAFIDYPPVIADLAPIAGVEGHSFSYALPAGTVTDIENDPLVISLQLQGGGALPAWLHFDSDTMTVSGTIPAGVSGNIALELRADDGHAATVKPVRLAIEHGNNLPVIAASSVVSGQIAELADTTGSVALDTASGSLSFSDLDSSDTHTATILQAVSLSGNIDGLPASADLLAMLSLTGLTEPTSDGPGSLGWSFSAPDHAFDYLGEGRARRSPSRSSWPTARAAS
jgi:hypothetical protein